MLFSQHPRTHYQRAPVHEVVCQLRFPTILSIDSREPADFQEEIRGAFPQYVRRQDMLPPRLTGGPAPKVEQQQPVTNYNFLSGDGAWKLNLTKDFIALSTLRYPGWESFARQLDQPLAAFIRLYRPAGFQRVGLRYVNLISRARLGLENTPWSDLLAPAYLGPLREEDVREDSLIGCGLDMTMKLDSSCTVKLHAGPGRLKINQANAPEDPEVRFILDMDFAMTGNISCTLAAGALETLHGHAGRLFEGALTERLRQAMQPAL